MSKFISVVFVAMLTSSCASILKSGPLNSPKSLDELKGNWKIVEFDGYRDRTPFSRVTFRSNGLNYTVGCVLNDLSATIEPTGKLIELPNPKDAVIIGTGCSKRQKAREKKLISFINNKPTIHYIDLNTLRFSTKSNRLLLRKMN